MRRHVSDLEVNVNLLDRWITTCRSRRSMYANRLLVDQDRDIVRVSKETEDTFQSTFEAPQNTPSSLSCGPVLGWLPTVFEPHNVWDRDDKHSPNQNLFVLRSA